MKKVLCPRCDNYLTFDETKYQGVGVIHFICQYCGRRFGVRLGSKEADAEKMKTSDGEECGSITVIENQFGYKQEFPLYIGDNIIGRRSKGTIVQAPIISGDMSMDRQHCIINVKRNKQGKAVYTLRDFPSLTGTFLFNELVGRGERIILSGAPIITIGATTFLVNMEGEENE
ncbi:MAG: FHA domain-containing protein [Bacteroidales bacterium]